MHLTPAFTSVTHASVAGSLVEAYIRSSHYGGLYYAARRRRRRQRGGIRIFTAGKTRSVEGVAKERDICARVRPSLCGIQRPRRSTSYCPLDGPAAAGVEYPVDDPVEDPVDGPA